MLREHIGYCGNGELPDDRKWIEGCYEMALAYLRAVIGKPPRNTAIEIVWDIVEQVDTPSLALVWHGPRTAAPSDYIEACAIALQCFEDGIDWERIAPKFVYQTVRDRAASRLWAWAPECNLSSSLTAVLLPLIRHRLTWSDYLYFLAQRWNS